MRVLIKFILISLTALVLGASGMLGFGYYAYHTPSDVSEARLIYIPYGSSVGQITRQLYEEQFIAYPRIFDLALRLTNTASKLKAGEFEIPPNTSMKQITDIIISGRSHDRFITIPEGLTSHQIVDVLNDNPYLKGNLKDIPVEGSLLPETYDYTRGQSREKLIRRMRQKMNDTLDQAWENRAPGLPLKSKDEALVLASIIEKETGVAGERKRVSGVFINRLRKGMRLQTDPSVIYAITKGKFENEGKGPLGRRLLYRDLEIDDPYNTYKYAGLPPGPIANPGKAAIEAALKPESHDYIYFVADGSGGHIFAKTLQQHNRNVANWRKIRDSQ